MVQELLADARDYERGNLGNVLELELQHLQLLRIAEDERGAWKDEQHRQSRE